MPMMIMTTRSSMRVKPSSSRILCRRASIAVLPERYVSHAVVSILARLPRKGVPTRQLG
jgi:hypothetical protein